MVMIRRATPADSAAILHCLQVAFEPFREFYSPQGFRDTTLTAEMLAERFQTMSIYVALGGDPEQVVGTIAGSVVGNQEGHIRGMAVLPDHHGKGVAERLLRTMEDELRQRGCTFLSLDTTAPLQRAIRFYERNGYRASGKVGDHFGMPLYEYVKKLG
jgi:ribosomal protein S18 acetylase RimI-like enzyme